MLNKSLHISFNAALLIAQPSLLHDDYGYEFSVFIGIDEFLYAHPLMEFDMTVFIIWLEHKLNECKELERS